MRFQKLPILVLLGALAIITASCVTSSNKSTMGRQASMVAREGREARTRYYRLGPKFEKQLDEMVGQEIMALAGRKEDLPLELNRDVLVNLNYFLNDARGFMSRSLERGQKYIPMMKAILRQKGLPEDLVYLALIESGFRTDAVSTAQAVGPWQFIASTGRNYGLTIDEWVDERMDPVKSTYAAADYLTALHDMFNSWPLAIAAYNSGEGKIQKGMRNPEVDNYWDMAKDNYLANETKRYVPSFLAVAIIAKDPAAYGLDVASSSPDAWEDVVVPESVDLELAAKLAGSTLDRLKELNPHLKKMTTPPGESNFVLRVPQGSTGQFYRSYVQLPASLRGGGLLIYAARRGETVEQVASTHGLTPEVVRRYNDLEGSRLARGQELILPSAMPPETPTVVAAANRSDRQTAVPTSASEPVYRTASLPTVPSASPNIRPVRRTTSVINTLSHRVRSGDTISGIARLYGVQADQIRSDNRLAGNTIREGQVLTIRSNLPLTSTASKRSGANWVEVSEGVPIYHTVKKGETISIIAANYRLSQDQLRSLNDLSGNAIRAGQKLRVGTGPAPTADEGLYVVQAGDTVSVLAERFHLSSDRLRQLNNLANDRLQIGQKLRVADPMARETRETPAAAAMTSTSTSTYKVVAGDTVSTIAERHQMTSEEFRRLNFLTNNNIRVGQELKVAVKVPAAAPAAAPSQGGGKVATYGVKSGDTISTIAERFGMTAANLRELNNLIGDSLREGQTLNVSASNSQEANRDLASSNIEQRSNSETLPVGSLYEVKSGDSVSIIAERFGLRSAQLRELNNLTSDKIIVGQKLKVGSPQNASTSQVAAQTSSPTSNQASPASPASQPTPPAPQAAAASTPSSLPPTDANGLYEVKSGDSVSTIAERFGLRSAQLRELNNLTSDKIRTGQKLKVSLNAGQSGQVNQANQANQASSTIASASQTRAPASAPNSPYVVKSGDSVSIIAERFGLRSAELRELNKLPNDNIKVGQKLIVTRTSGPTAGTSTSVSPSKPAAAPAAQSTSASDLYEVKSGDTVSTIAERFGLRSAELRELNNLTGDNIRSGQKLKVTRLKPPAAPSSSLKTHKVEAGETLFSIASRYNMTVAYLKELNSKSDDSLKPGQILIVN
ncbi:MAG: LysM peptidoglycan-binding domain-containing protein [Deltaproteobacteria bacterium]|jgi:membrane-bound lytic murein transglycosylase D|nr:LysM peptidoglycan-binding domain-containing protein [Deltaproteobacteria bacterium]